jgi:hypothetical protein
MTVTVWLYDDPRSGYHDTGCRCDGHCRNCYEDLAAIRALRDRLVAENSPAADRPLHPLARYCSPYCRGRAARERALDRALAAHPTARKEGNLDR